MLRETKLSLGNTGSDYADDYNPISSGSYSQPAMYNNNVLPLETKSKDLPKQEKSSLLSMVAAIGMSGLALYLGLHTTNTMSMCISAILSVVFFPWNR